MVGRFNNRSWSDPLAPKLRLISASASRLRSSVTPAQYSPVAVAAQPSLVPPPANLSLRPWPAGSVSPGLSERFTVNRMISDVLLNCSVLYSPWRVCITRWGIHTPTRFEISTTGSATGPTVSEHRSVRSVTPQGKHRTYEVSSVPQHLYYLPLLIT